MRIDVQALITVTRGTDGAISVSSSAFAVTRVECSGGAGFWPTDSPHNFCLMGVDPLTKTATVWYGACVPW